MKGNFKTLNKNKGITLIALVITIIVLLILAGVSIAMLTGQNGILTQAQNSNIQNSHGAVKDAIALLYNEYQIEINTASNVKLASTEIVTIQGEEEKALANTSLTFLQFLQGENSQGINYLKEGNVLNVEVLTGSKQALGNGEDATNDVYKIEEENGNYVVKYYEDAETSVVLWQVSQKPGEIDWDSILADANANPEKYKHPDQSDSNGDIGIGADGNPVNMDKWQYTPNNNEISFVGKVVGGYGASSKIPSYSYEYDDEGNVITDIVCPQYIKIDGTDEFYEVTSIGEYAFYYLDELTSVVLPDSITEIGFQAFYQCSSLTNITIPDSLTSIDYYAFDGCSSLTEVNYNGTIEEWNAISGNDELSNATIHCTDGDIIPST